MNKQLKIWIALVFFAPFGLYAQVKSTYDKKQVFDPQFFTNNGNEMRSGNGAPGPKYWQNRADYVIHATLLEKDTMVKGDVSINYTNNSPDTMNYLWLQLDQNLFRNDSRGTAVTPAGDRFDSNGFKGGYNIGKVSVVYAGKTYAITPYFADTRMQIRLPFAVKQQGDKITINIDYSFAIPEHGADRMGRLSTQNGMIYQLAQWFPRMCVFDDLNGWNTLPYLGNGEFYCEYGDIDYYITACADMIVAGSGDLQNPQQVLTSTKINRLAKAAKSDSTVSIVGKDELNSSGRKSSGTLTWHYKMNNTRDVAWAASRAFLWDAARVNLPSGKKGMAMAVYPVESVGRQHYSRAVEYLKSSMEFYSNTYYEYPYHNAFVVAGVALGMEYPGIVFCSHKIVNDDLFRDIAHEIGHNWFPMIVGSDERRYGWMDEGFNTFINGYVWTNFNNGEYAEKKSPALGLTKGMQKEHDPLMIAPDANDDGGMFYYKTALALNILRNVVLEPDRFDYAFKTYINRWAYKHPQPYDFFRTMNNAAGEDLNWFWKEWFYTTWNIDQTVTHVRYIKNDSASGAFITIENLREMALPVIAKITEENGKVQTIKLPVEIWQHGSKWVFKYNSTSKIKQIVLDPDNQLPDTDRSNNIYEIK
ncbi:M1 family metallopeptidase [Mucilaginibacter sp. BT774]|uniref:M1 family metallopeptidase n=1 Tax=Mucilaginibacter sp. BT774 TaxID=3062276 RepID=UPI002675F22B|nr:M1 family metallopeptidase [Mucilaginibacter sp. BT774]MDO3629038.1 M1 family metallopeptidase [Mucilaginibacter sp. BT774]